MTLQVGDLVRFVAKDYGPGIKDQWVGLVGIVSSIDEETHHHKKSCTVIVKHPEDSAPAEVLAFEHDLEVVTDG